MNRGINRQEVFLTDEHRNIFLFLLDEISNKFSVEIHAYCLMGNHYHLLIRTSLANLGRAMRHLDGIYTQRFNRSVNRDGPLFRGRYKAILVESENYLLQLSRYIHLNPIQAKLCNDPYEYHWSSLQFFSNNKTIRPWLKTDLTLSLMNAQNPHKSYIEFINQGVDEETKKFYSAKCLRSIMGSRSFINMSLEKINKKINFLMRLIFIV